MRSVVLLLLGLLVAVPSAAQYRSHSGNSRSRSSSSAGAPRTSRRSEAAPGVARWAAVQPNTLSKVVPS
jgi:hypothetical protein